MQIGETTMEMGIWTYWQREEILTVLIPVHYIAMKAAILWIPEYPFLLYLTPTMNGETTMVTMTLIF